MKSMHPIERAAVLAGVDLILLSLVRGAEGNAAGLAVGAFLVLGWTSYPPVDARHATRAAAVFAGVVGLLVAGALFEEVGADGPRAPEEMVMLMASVLVVGDTAQQILRAPGQDGPGDRWPSESAQPRPVPRVGI